LIFNIQPRISLDFAFLEVFVTSASFSLPFDPGGPEPEQKCKKIYFWESSFQQWLVGLHIFALSVGDMSEVVFGTCETYFIEQEC